MCPVVFPMEQAGKVRPIDDLSQSQINATVTCSEQTTVNGPDVIFAFAVFLMRVCLKKESQPSFWGGPLDLASAYGQLAISDNSKCDAYLSVYSPAGGRAELFRQVALPFGSRTAVNALIRRVRFLQWVAARCLEKSFFLAISTTLSLLRIRPYHPILRRPCV